MSAKRKVVTERGLNNNKCTVSQFDEVNDTDGSVHCIWIRMEAFITCWKGHREVFWCWHCGLVAPARVRAWAGPWLRSWWSTWKKSVSKAPDANFASNAVIQKSTYIKFRLKQIWQWSKTLRDTNYPRRSVLKLVKCHINSYNQLTLTQTE